MTSLLFLCRLKFFCRKKCTNFSKYSKNFLLIFFISLSFLTLLMGRLYIFLHHNKTHEIYLNENVKQNQNKFYRLLNLNRAAVSSLITKTIWKDGYNMNQTNKLKKQKQNPIEKETHRYTAYDGNISCFNLKLGLAH